MRKICFSIFVVVSMILLMVSFSLAETSPRQPTSSLGKTTFTNISVTGLDDDGSDVIITTGTPAYIEMTSCKGDVYYLYIGYDGNLLIASESQVGTNASPAITGGWADGSGVIVGNQN